MVKVLGKLQLQIFNVLELKIIYLTALTLQRTLVTTLLMLVLIVQGL